MSKLTLTGLYRYPVKSLAGEALRALEVDARGLRLDRHWMLIDRDGRFLTQRQQPRMTLIRTLLDDADGLLLQAPGMPDLQVPVAGGERREVVVWQDRVSAAPVGRAVDQWLSDFLATPCHLVVMPDEANRPVDQDFAEPSDQVGFADGFPFLLISQGSLEDLNARLEQPVPMQRFRPNLVVSGCQAFAEDGWQRIRIGQIEFRVAKACSRCIIPTIDPQTGERGREPLQTLMSYRKRDNKTYFGQNLVHEQCGQLELGMPVEVLA